MTLLSICRSFFPPLQPLSLALLAPALPLDLKERWFLEVGGEHGPHIHQLVPDFSLWTDGRGISGEGGRGRSEGQGRDTKGKETGDESRSGGERK
jgi:hypothetical protein